MGSDTLLLMQLYWRLDWRQTSERPGMRVLRVVLLGGLGLLLAGMSALGGFGIGRAVATPQFQLSFSQGLVPGALLTLVLLTVLITGPNQAVRALYLSNDLDQLVAAPIHTRSILMGKLLSRLSWNVFFILLLAGPALVAYGIGIGAGLGYYVAGFLLLLLAPLFGISIGALVAMVLVRWLPAKRLGELLAAAYALIGIVIALLFQLPRFFVDEQGAETILNAVDSVADAPIPTLWAGQGLIDVSQGQVSIGLGRMVAYIILTLGLFVFTVWISDKLYLSGWLRMQGISAKRRGLAEDRGRLSNGSLTNSVAIKDWLMRIRDPRQLVSLIGGGVVAAVVGGLAIFRGSGGNDTGLLQASQSGDLAAAIPFDFVGALFSPGIIMAGAVLFIGYAVFSQLALTSLALEGQSYVVLKSAPVTGRDVWWAKSWGAWLPYALTMTLLLIVAWLVVGFNLAWTVYAWLIMLIIGVGLIAVNTTVGFRYANLEWTDTRRMTTGGGGLYSFLLSTVYSLVIGLTAVVFFVLAAAYPSWAIPAAVVGVVVAAALTALWTWVMGNWADNVWKRIGEQ